MSIPIAILGASGYTGAETIRLLLGHPQVRIAALTADAQAGKPMLELYPHLAFADLPELVRIEAVDFSAVDAVFCCLPHGTTQQVIAGLPSHLKIIDLSADFRLADVQSYAQWYDHAHQAPQLQREAVYGLTEQARREIKEARLVANPGCYPTSVLLPLMPLLASGLILKEGIIIDAKSGTTGAGRSARQTMIFSEISGGLSAYGVGHHRHTPEIEQGLSRAAGEAVSVSFTPHLVPMSRGILSTMYVTLAPGADALAARECLQDIYRHEPFVRVMPQGVAPSTHEVRGTNECRIGIFADRVPGRAILVSVIDNLVKGAAGQAVQNFNVMMGFPEPLGLTATALFP
ncbi:MAG: N-acetyl-gamma-glutamyl-phosphate reductase [Alphaproteobacteria bacterium]|nr:N-acetyl-gamma-glutamyl-phosphate reductase [Alphaproteobacteria bacterium]